jgi:hypothetical protein
MVLPGEKNAAINGRPGPRGWAFFFALSIFQGDAGGATILRTCGGGDDQLNA